MAQQIFVYPEGTFTPEQAREIVDNTLNILDYPYAVVIKIISTGELVVMWFEDVQYLSFVIESTLADYVTFAKENHED